MKINNIGYLLKEGVKGIFTHGFMSFAAVCVTVACLLIVGSFSLLTYNVNIMVEDLNQTNEILLYIDSSLSEAKPNISVPRSIWWTMCCRHGSFPGRKHWKILLPIMTATALSAVCRLLTCVTGMWSPWKTTC